MTFLHRGIPHIFLIPGYLVFCSFASIVNIFLSSILIVVYT